jgi:hypothetical protein
VWLRLAGRLLMSMRLGSHRWTNHELRELRALAAAGLTRAQAAKAMGLPLSVVQHGSRNYGVAFIHPPPNGLKAKNPAVRPDGGACAKPYGGRGAGDCRP